MESRPNNFTLSSSYTRKPYTEIVEDILNDITKGIAREKFVFKGSQPDYLLSARPRGIVEIEGTSRGRKYVFEKNSDYAFLEERGVVAWGGGATRPDEGTEFKVTYTFKDASGLSDTNPGSVLRTIVEAVSKELDYLYEQMDGVYKSAFVDTAAGTALDNVASLIGIERKPATRSMGYVTFWRDSDPPDVAISKETMLFDGRDSYPLNEGPLKAITSVSGILKGISYSFNKGKDYDTDIAKNSLVWLLGGAKPDTNTPFSVDYIVHEKIFVPRGMLVSTPSSQKSSIMLFETMQEATLKRSDSGKWETDVQVRAVVPGYQGNVIAGAIALMPKPAIGVEHIVNRSNLAGGADIETDEFLRGRARQALELAGKATIGSLRTALESIEGIQSAPRIRENPDGIPGLIKVVIDGGDEGEIGRVIEDTRAAGIRVEFYRPKIVSLDFDLIVVPKIANMPSAKLEALKALISAKIMEFVSALRIDEDLVYYQLLSAVLGIEGVRDIKQMTIDVFKDGTKASTSSKENIVASADERLYPRIVNLTFQEDLNR
ncbi:MAG TPA: baseplate J/gp47 family protein [Nitrososphaera sp.]|nr:baseplate J/gp47 family protein [Nitrososphaera sp.]